MKVKLIFMLMLLSSIGLANESDSLKVSGKQIRTTDYKFKLNPFVKKPILSSEKPFSFDLSFLKEYDFKTYKMGDYYINNSLICMPFNEWGTDVIPYHLSQQTFTVFKRKRKRKK